MKQAMLYSTVPTTYTNEEVSPWDDVGVSFRLMCPFTTRPCHSRCMAFKPFEPARAGWRHVGDTVDMELRRGPAVVGRCELLP